MTLTQEEIDDLEAFVDGEEDFCYMNRSTVMARQAIKKLRQSIQSVEKRGEVSPDSLRSDTPE